MEYKGYEITLREGLDFNVRVTASAAFATNSGEKSYTVHSDDNMIYQARCDVGTVYALEPELALTSIKTLIDKLQE